MASITDMLVQGATQTAQQSGEQLTSGIKTGAALAEQVEQTRMRREQMEQQKEQLQMQKANSVVDTMKIAASSKDKRLKDFLLKKVLPAKVNALGMDKFFTPQTLEMVQTSEDAQKKVLGLQLDLDEKVRSGQMTGGAAYREAQRILSDPEELALLDTDRLFDAQTFKNSEEGKSARNTQTAQASLNKQVQGQEAAPDVKYQTTIKADKAKFEGEGGGLPNAEAQIKKLKEVVMDFKSGKLKTGNLGSTAGSLLGSTAQAVINPDLKAAMDKTRASIRLKDSLDSQFAAKEAEQQYSMRTIDPALPTEDNLARAEDMLAEAEALLNSKLKAFGIERKAKGKTYNIGGRSATPEQAKAFYTANPNAPSLTPEIKKELGL